MHPHLLLILDGYGIAEDPSVSAIDAARKPFLDALFAAHPRGTLRASERAVGLPVGQMGNSEVGHMNLGAGRVVFQDLVRIDAAIEDESFYANAVLVDAARHARTSGTRLHLVGLVSDGGVHSHVSHLIAMLELARREGLRDGDVLVHVITDGRDTSPTGAGDRFIPMLEAAMRETGVGRIATVCGRYWAMDRDRRWERTERAYLLLTANADTPAAAPPPVDAEASGTADPAHPATAPGTVARFDTAAEALAASYAAGVTDEFVAPAVIGEGGVIGDGDALVVFNFRADRARQIVRALTDPDFGTDGTGFARQSVPKHLHVATFASYDEAFDVPVAFPKQNLTQTIGEVVSAHGGRQLRAAETEKYPHVTFFFSGGREAPFEGETRILVPSPKDVATYDLKPEMSVVALSEAVAARLVNDPVEFAVVNFANADMVGHTGVFEAAVAAVEAVDSAARVVVEAALKAGYGVTILADHGNADKMRNADGSPHTAHTLALVPHVVIHPRVTGAPRDGKLGDVAPTILTMMGLPVPPEMTGEVLVEMG